jgi:hypothetical protein
MKTIFAPLMFALFFLSTLSQSIEEQAVGTENVEQVKPEDHVFVGVLLGVIVLVK